MKKTLLASAIALSIGSAASVQAQVITITVMKFGGAFPVTGTMNSNGDGSMRLISNSASRWTADQQNWFDTHSTMLTWSGTGTSANNSNAFENFTYTFSLSNNQVAIGTFFDFKGDNNIPVLTIYDCPVSGGGVCLGKSLPMVTEPFPGAAPKYNGTTSDDFPVSGVPVPAAVWLMGSGLLGLIGVARRRKFQPALK